MRQKAASAPDQGEKTQALYVLHWMPGLTPASRTVGAWLVWHANGSTGRCDPGQSRLRKETGLSPRAIKGAIAELVELELIHRKQRTNTSNSYAIQWTAFGQMFKQFEQAANAGGEVVKVGERRRKRGRNVPQGGAEMCTTPVSKSAHKDIEVNTRNEDMFRGRHHSDKSENGVFESFSDDEVGVRILSTKPDAGFLAYLDREVRSGRLFGREIADRIRIRLEEIYSGETEGHGQGDPIIGRAYRLLEMEFEREEAA